VRATSGHRAKVAATGAKSRIQGRGSIQLLEYPGPGRAGRGNASA
jgi:hypothetical protein